jgi:hypothetical protein
MPLLEILQLKLTEALRSDLGNEHAVDNLEDQILHNTRLHELVRQRALERRGLQTVPDYDPDHIPGVLRKHNITRNGKQCAATIKAGRRRQLKLPSWDGGFLG